MNGKLSLLIRFVVLMYLTAWSAGQQTAHPAVTTATVVPNVINFSGVLTDLNGEALSDIQGVTFLLYGSQQGGAPLWMETQNIRPGTGGQYTATLGTNTSQGLPAELFARGEARWLAVQVSGQPEQPRVLLVAVPYAMKASDAETIGGLPPSAFVLAAPPNGAPAAANNSSLPSSSLAAPAPVNVTTSGSGTANTLTLFSTPTDIENSVVTQSGSGSTAKIGIGTTTPFTTLDVKGSGTIRGALNLPPTGTATAAAGKNSQPLNLASSSFNSGTSTAVNQTFQWQAEAVGNDTNTATGSLNLLFGQGTSKPAETGLSIASNGQITFPTGQTFPGTGTITGVTAGTGLTGGGTNGSLTLNLDATKVPLLAAANTFTANQTVSGTVTATSFSGNGASLTNVNANQLGGLGSSAFAQLAAANTFTARQTISNTTVMTGTDANGVLQVTNTVLSGKGPAIVGAASSSQANGIVGVVTATTGIRAGVLGTTASTAGFGVEGDSPFAGVYGTTSGTAATNYGVEGLGITATGSATGVYGASFSASGYGVEGVNTNSSGVFGQGAFGVNGVGSFYGVVGTATPATGATAGVFATSESSNGMGVQAQSPNIGVFGITSGTSATNYGMEGMASATTGTAVGVFGSTSSPGGYGVYGAGGIGVWGASTLCPGTPPCEGGYFTGYTAPSSSVQNGGDGIDSYGGDGGQNAIYLTLGGAGVLGVGGLGSPVGEDGPGGAFTGGKSSAGFGDGIDGIAGSGLAGNFTGDLNVSGKIIAGGKDFKIDHPLDPANKYLVHASVESSEMMNIYTGNVTTDEQGEATVQLPEWFEVLNTDFRYQLTVIGQFAQAIVAREIQNHQFQIRTNAPNVKVSWQVTGVRQDAFAKAHPLVVEEEKDARLKGFYIHPELYGAPDEKQIEWARHPQLMKRMKENRERPARATAAALAGGPR